MNEKGFHPFLYDDSRQSILVIPIQYLSNKSKKKQRLDGACLIFDTHLNEIIKFYHK